MPTPHRDRLAAALTGLLATALPARAQGVSGGRMPTRWDRDINPAAPLPDYPRPQMTRPRWQSLNGPWRYARTGADAATAPATYPGTILVSCPYESALSGVGGASPVSQRLWYRRTFTVPASWRTGGQRVLLHFGAVNWDSTVSVNGQALGGHRGGYDPFDYDITGALRLGADTLVVSAQNPLRTDVADAQVLGKQRRQPGNIFYTAATGIWQSAWLEPVPAAHSAGLVLTPDVDAQALRVTVDAGGAAGSAITLPAALPARLGVLAEHDEDVDVYVNSVPAASAAGFTGAYARLPVSGAARAAPHPGANVIAVHCRQTVGGQVIDVGLAAALELIRHFNWTLRKNHVNQAT